MTLTPQQRLEAYKYSKNCLLKPANRSIGVCSLLEEYLAIVLDIYPDDLLNYFPEFVAQKPKVVKGIYWWNSFNQRLAALDRAIELVKEKI